MMLTVMVMLVTDNEYDVYVDDAFYKLWSSSRSFHSEQIYVECNIVFFLPKGVTSGTVME